MEEFFPSEIARLVLGYLEITKCSNSWKTFFEESSDLQEYSRLFKEGKIYTTTVNGKSLSDILTEYCALKPNAVKNPNKCNCNCKCNLELQKITENKTANGFQNTLTLSTDEPATDNTFASRHSNFPTNNSVQDTQNKRYTSTPYDNSSVKRKKILQSQRVTNNFQNKNGSKCIEVIELDAEKNNPMLAKVLNKYIDISDTTYKTIHRTQDFENRLDDTLVVEENNYSKECHVNNSNDKLNETIKIEENEEQVLIPKSLNMSESLDFVLSKVKNGCEYTVNDIKAADAHVDNANSSGNGKNYSESDLTNQVQLVCKGPSPTILSCTSLVSKDTVEYDEAAKMDEGNQVIGSVEFVENELQIVCENENINNPLNSYNNILNETESSTGKETTSIVPISQHSNQPNSGNEMTFSDTPVVLIPSYSANEIPSQNCLQYSVIWNSDFNYMTTGRNIKILPKLATSPTENDIQNENIPIRLKSVRVSGEKKKSIYDDPTKNVKNKYILPAAKPQANKKKVSSTKLKSTKRKTPIK